MLKGYGVGDENATALAATMTWILRSKVMEPYHFPFKWDFFFKFCSKYWYKQKTAMGS